jgi:hypothetical protein
MTATVTEMVAQTIMTHSHEALSASLGVIAILLLATLLLQKEVLRASAGARAKDWVGVLNIAIVPLLLAFGFIIATRLLDLL